MSVQQNDRNAMNNDGMLHLMVEAATALTQLVDRAGTTSSSNPTQPKGVHNEQAGTRMTTGTTVAAANDKQHRDHGIVTPPLSKRNDATRPMMLHRRGGTKVKVLTNGQTVVSDDDDMCTVVTNTSSSCSSQSSHHVHQNNPRHGMVAPSFSTNHSSAADFSATPVPPSSSPPEEIVHSSRSSSSSPSGSSKSSRETFPQKLMRILSNPAVGGVIRWLPHGKSFCILNPQEFADSVLPMYFSVHKYPSFTRKLNRWGFRQISRGSDAGAFSHALFQRDATDLCLGMLCEKSSNRHRSHKSSSPSSKTHSSTTSNNHHHHKTTPDSSIPQNETTKNITQQGEIVSHKKRLHPGDVSSCNSNNIHISVDNISSSSSLPPKKRRFLHVESSSPTTSKHIKVDVNSSVTQVHDDPQESSNHNSTDNEVKMQSCMDASTVSNESQQQQKLAAGPYAMFTLELLNQRRKLVEEAMMTLMQHHSRSLAKTQKAQLTQSFHKAIITRPSLLPPPPVVNHSNTAVLPISSFTPPTTPKMIDPPILSTMLPALASTTPVSRVLPQLPQMAPSLAIMTTTNPPKPQDKASNMLYQAYLQAVVAKGGSNTPAPTNP
jgi:hypothetical protein